jgi:aminopeptidase N
MASLTHADATQRARLITVREYQVELDLPGAGPLFQSRTTVRFSSRPRRSTFIEVRPHRLVSARLNGQELPAEAFDARTGRLTLDRLAAENELIVEADMAYSHDGEGLHQSIDPADDRTYLYAMSFLDAGPRWFACFDQPDLKASYTFRVSCPPDWTVAGNAPAVAGEPGQWTLGPTPPISTYTTTLVAGPYYSLRETHDGIPLALHVRASLSEHLDAEAAEIFDVTRRSFDEFHRLFGIRYPWGEYHQAFVPEFNAGAMENPGCVTLRDTAVFRSRVTDSERGQRASMISHEMAHMWFGDLVTMRWWDDLWLNESFAEYLGQRVSDVASPYPSWVEFSVLRKAWGYAADRRPSTHPVAGNGAPDAATALNDFDGISYAKGAALLKQLAASLGDEVFLTGLRSYFAQHAYGNAELGDLLSAWTSAGAGWLPAWADEWLRTSGVDTVTVRPGQPPVLARSAGSPRTHVLQVAGYSSAGQLIDQTAVAVGREAVPLAGWADQAALVLPDATDQTWAKIQLSGAEWQAMPRLLRTLTDPLARTVVWNALRLAVADAEVAPRLALDIVAASLPAETADAVVSALLGWATSTVAGRMLTGEPRVKALAQLASVARSLAAQREPSSGLALAALRGYLATTTDAGALRRWLDGAPLPGGIELDPDLRWLATRRLCTLGELGPAGIDHELDRDRSAQGEVEAATCRALLPAPAAKAAAWQLLMSDTQVSNYVLYATAEGFWHPEQAELTRPYAERYFAEIPATAALRTGWTVGRVALLAFPSTAIDEEVVSAAQAMGEDDQLDPNIRRSVIDAGDDLRRTLAVRMRYPDGGGSAAPGRHAADRTAY